MISGDSGDYKSLTKWAKDFDCQGYYSCEIGVRKGMGSKIIMDNVKNNFLHLGVDPYGDRVYQHFDKDYQYTWTGNEKGVPPTYSNDMRDEMLRDLFPYILQGRYHLVNFTDTKFMQMEQYKDSKFSFVFLDGPHTTKDVLTEAIWFANKAAPHTRIIFDDFRHYNMQLIDECLTYFGFKVFESSKNKVCMEKNGN
jgi:hypothetical protein|tara:strand:+ start:619 stop:1206 length:588 start_codon:yes stop_codon:yes gene_type:complete